MKISVSHYADYAYALLRIVAGFLFACHGAQKLFGVLGSEPKLDGLGITAGSIEFFGGLLIAVGLVANCAAFIASGEMAVAYFKSHAPHGFFPILNHGELAVLLCFFFLYVALRGAGPVSFDALFRGRKE
ncbi:MAG TPA: DoxX family protein [Terriglobales bacterium]|nr:DoxX family protein [Terriglobales bacterium]